MAIIGISGKMQSGKDTVALIIQYLTDPYAVKDKLTYQQWKEEHDTVMDGCNRTASEWETKRWADGVKDCVCIMIGCTREQLEDIDFKNKPLGEEWRRWFGIHYKVVSNTNNGRMTPYFNTKEEAEEEYKFDSRFQISSFESELLTPRMVMQQVGTEGGRLTIHPNVWVYSLISKYVPYSARGSEYEFEESMWLIPDTRFVNEAEAIKKKKGFVIRVNTNRAGMVSNHPSETSLDDYKGFDYIIDNSGTLDELVDKVRVIFSDICLKWEQE
jgi:hypothetical protein